MKPVMTIQEMTDFLAKVFPQIAADFEIIHMDGETVDVRMNVKERHLRPGNTVSGPSMFALADVAYYIATMARIGPEALTVTTNCSIDFMRKPAPSNMIGKARVLKLGKTLSVGDVMLYSEGMDEPVAHANLTYAIPPARK
ncbi:thioesterase [Amylibacter kogurei]|uniref:Thioesterase n=1 Tax=Paramylibacter kogurei TaxID=1889778 RepID=A0A2G5K6V6_9RHOB|nr:PaaI family thioesterase [Amylibacter kogurei]PIB24839.1 thioesterase [Amylibacter kogurei]